jgi:hypothetical protein
MSPGPQDNAFSLERVRRIACSETGFRRRHVLYGGLTQDGDRLVERWFKDIANGYGPRLTSVADPLTRAASLRLAPSRSVRFGAAVRVFLS